MVSMWVQIQPVVMTGTTSPQQAETDWSEAWEILTNPKNTTDTNKVQLDSMLDALGASSAKTLKVLDEADFRQLAELLKKAPKRLLLVSLNLS